MKQTRRRRARQQKFKKYGQLKPYFDNVKIYFGVKVHRGRGIGNVLRKVVTGLFSNILSI